MNLKISLVILAVFLAACQPNRSSESTTSLYSNLIEVEQLKEIIERPDIKIIDFRKEEEYLNEHIPGAVQMWRDDIEDSSYPYKGMMASASQLESLFQSKGISSSDLLLVYDDDGLCNAARLWWTLQNYDFENVMLLNGGIAAWKNAGGLLSQEIPTPDSGTFKLSKFPSMRFHLTKKEVLQLQDQKATIIDTRTADEFSGKRQKKGASKAGRIPGSIHIDWAEAIDYSGDKKIKPKQELRSIYTKLEPTKETPLIVYCHTGVRSAHTTFVLTQILGYKNVKNYDGSWSEWSYFNDLPFEIDSLTTQKP